MQRTLSSGFISTNTLTISQCSLIDIGFVMRIISFSRTVQVIPTLVSVLTLRKTGILGEASILG